MSASHIIKLVVRDAVKITSAIFILTPVAIIYICASSIASVFKWVADVADFLGREFDHLWEDKP